MGLRWSHCTHVLTASYFWDLPNPTPTRCLTLLRLHVEPDAQVAPWVQQPAVTRRSHVKRQPALLPRWHWLHVQEHQLWLPETAAITVMRFRNVIQIYAISNQWYYIGMLQLWLYSEIYACMYDSVSSPLHQHRVSTDVWEIVWAAADETTEKNIYMWEMAVIAHWSGVCGGICRHPSAFVHMTTNDSCMYYGPSVSPVGLVLPVQGRGWGELLHING